MRAVLDTNVIISAALSSRSSPARVMQAWLEGGYELVVSGLLLDELARALAYPKLRARVTQVEAVALLRSGADLRSDPASPPPVRPSDPDDDYVVALAAGSKAVIVSGDRHLLNLGDRLPVYTPAAFLSLIERRLG